MVPRTVRCLDCEETRVGREVDGEIKPYKPECPDCGSEKFDVVVR